MYSVRAILPASWMYSIMPSTMFRKRKRCKHVHYSGRRCATLIPPHDLFCRPHRSMSELLCVDCQAMLAAFPIRRSIPRPSASEESERNENTERESERKEDSRGSELGQGF